MPYLNPHAADLFETSLSLRNLAAFLDSQGIRKLAPLGAGSTSVVLAASRELVARIGRGRQPPRRVKAAEMLQAQVAGSDGVFRWELLERVDTSGIRDEDVVAVSTSLQAQGYVFFDAGKAQLGRTRRGQLVVVDGESVRPLPRGRGEVNPWAALP